MAKRKKTKKSTVSVDGCSVELVVRQKKAAPKKKKASKKKKGGKKRKSRK